MDHQGYFRCKECTSSHRPWRFSQNPGLHQARGNSRGAGGRGRRAALRPGRGGPAAAQPSPGRGGPWWWPAAGWEQRPGRRWRPGAEAGGAGCRAGPGRWGLSGIRESVVLVTCPEGKGLQRAGSTGCPARSRPTRPILKGPYLKSPLWSWESLIPGKPVDLQSLFRAGGSIGLGIPRGPPPPRGPLLFHLRVRGP